MWKKRGVRCCSTHLTHSSLVTRDISSKECESRGVVQDFLYPFNSDKKIIIQSLLKSVRSYEGTSVRNVDEIGTGYMIVVKHML